jgi:type 1 glutamine amidotransferase
MYGKGRTFATTIGHHNETMREEAYLDLVARGLLWACDKLDEDGRLRLKSTSNTESQRDS